MRVELHDDARTELDHAARHYDGEVLTCTPKGVLEKKFMDMLRAP